MPIRPPALDDRSFDDLVDELLARIPAHTPEWTHPHPGDPGRTLIDLFAWLTDTLLYRANLIPERQRLAFLRLLGVQMRPALPARGVVSITIDDDTVSHAVSLAPRATVSASVSFETRMEVTLLPVTAEAYYKRPLTPDEKAGMDKVLSGLQAVYNLPGQPTPYVTTPVFPGGRPEPDGFDLIERTVDRALWLALLAPKASKPELQAGMMEQVRAALGRNASGGQQLLSIGVMPAIEVPALFEEIGPRAQIPHLWEIGTLNDRNQPDYLTLDLVADSTAGLTRRGVLRLALPAASKIKVPSNDLAQNVLAGVGDAPPRLDVPEKAARLVAWIRLRSADSSLRRLSLSWIGINAVEIDQRQTLTGRIVGQSDGSADQLLTLPGQSIEAETLRLEVEETDRGYQPWRQIDDLALAGRDSAVFNLDSEAGTVRFGDGVRGRIPEAGRRVRAAFMRTGGGRAGNLPAGSLTQVSAKDLTGRPVTMKLKVIQSLPTDGGEDRETLVEAERRIPALFRHRERAVTEEDYKRLAADVPGVSIGRVELLPRFKPQQRRFDVPGVVTVMTLPRKPGFGLPNPRPDRPFLEGVHAFLSERKPLGTELYVIGCDYVPLGISIGITVRDGFGQGPGGAGGFAGDGFAREGVVAAVREALRRYLWPLAPGGIDGTGWPLGRPVRDRELEVAAARVPGVGGVSPVNLFEKKNEQWRKIPRPTQDAPVQLTLMPWQLPELLTVVVTVGDAAPEDLRGALNPFAGLSDVAVPVVPEVC